MSDIVKRLRQVPALTTGFVVEIEYELDKVAMDAADEIERLRAERDALRELLREAREWHIPLNSINDKRGLAPRIDAVLKEHQP